MTFARPTSSDSHHSNFNAHRQQDMDAELEQDPDHDPEADPDVELEFHEGHIGQRNSRNRRYSSRGGSARSPPAAAVQTGAHLTVPGGWVWSPGDSNTDRPTRLVDVCRQILAVSSCVSRLEHGKPRKTR